MELLPELWKNVIQRNPNFCDHVCHAWLARSLRLMELQNGHMSSREGIEKNNEQIPESSFIGVYTTKSYGNKKKRAGLFKQASVSIKKVGKVTWKPSGQRKITGTWFGLAESLIEQYNAHIMDVEEVHEREMKLIVWKHFILALAQCLLNAA
ncbi:unnamed protein product, partial [Mesorhabditis spiculigera]